MKPLPPKNDDVIILDDPEHGVEFTHRKNWREALRVILTDQRWQWVIIILIVIDALLVSADILIAGQTCGDHHVSESVHHAEKAIRRTSISILSFFVLEWIVEAIVHGVRRWVRSPIHIVDIVIVCISLALEIVAEILESNLAQVGGLLVVFRLWRVVRVSHAVKDVGKHLKEDQIKEMQKEITRLKSVQDAHHMVITELHHEYSHRLIAVQQAAEERYQAAKAAASQADPEAAAVIAQLDAEDDTAAEKLLHDTKPSHDTVMSQMCRRNPSVRHAVALHIDSVHDRQKELEEAASLRRMPAIGEAGEAQETVRGEAIRAAKDRDDES